MRQLKCISGIIIAILFMVLSGCATQSETMKSQGYPAAYAEGFEDGCHSGKKAGGSHFDPFKKDVRRFNNDGDSAQGWSDAFRQREAEQDALDRNIHISMEEHRTDNERKDRMAHDALKGIDTTGLENLK